MVLCLTSFVETKTKKVVWNVKMFFFRVSVVPETQFWLSTLFGLLCLSVTSRYVIDVFTSNLAQFWLAMT